MAQKRMILFVILLSLTAFSGISSGGTPIESFISKIAPRGWVLADGPRTYTKKSLFEHIDGQAELFFKYGFQKSVFAAYQNEKNPESQIELDIYDMENGLQAFGIFSRFRNEENPAGVGSDSYFHENSVFFYQGRYFVILYASESDPSALKRFSIAVSSKISDRSPPPKEIGYFPADGLKRGSIQYSPEGILGHQFLKGGFQGIYAEKDEAQVKAEVEDKDKTENGHKECRLFLATFKDPRDPAKALKIYKDYLTQKGKVFMDHPAGFGSNTLRGEDPYQGQVIVTQEGIYLLGASGFREPKNGESLLREFLTKVRKAKRSGHPSPASP